MKYYLIDIKYLILYPNLGGFLGVRFEVGEGGVKLAPPPV